MNDAGDLVQALLPLVEALEALEVPYRVGGSVATSAYGVPRSTLDVDIVCDLPRQVVCQLVGALEEGYYVDAEMIHEAIVCRSSFNIIHLETMLKVDVFVLNDRPFDREAFQRSIEDTLEDEPNARSFLLSTPEDMILHKLRWYRLSNEISERQWLDVLGVLKVRGASLDRSYLRHWAQALGISELYERALKESGGFED